MITTTRRKFIASAGLTGAFGFTFPAGSTRAAWLAPAGQSVEMVDELIIDLSSEPATLDPATTYEVNGWSIVHSVYDSLLQYGVTGDIELLLAESFTQIDPTTIEIKLRSGITFHNGEPLTVASIAAAHAHIMAEETASSIAGNFATIASIETVDELTARLILSQPSPWLPAQIAAWLVCLPPALAESADLGSSPVGTGPYRFVEWASGQHVILEVNPDYPVNSVKGQPIARRVVFRFVAEPSTRVADLLSGTAHIIRAVPVDQVPSVEEAGGAVTVNPISGATFVRIPTDVAPFDDVRVRKALNFAVDVDSIVAALLGGHGARAANFFAEGGLGYDATLLPYSYDPDMARALLAEAGYPEGFKTRLSYATLERGDLVEAIAAQLEGVGVDVEVEQVEVATFNQQWTDPEAAELRFVTWRPMFDPYTLLSLIVSNSGFLSRHDNPNAQTLIDAAAVEPDPIIRADLYRQLGLVLHDEPAGIYLWSMTSLYGSANGSPVMTPRPDDYMIPTTHA